jgi:branched-subunit amino acid transport protein
MSIWGIILAMGVVTYALRLSFLLIFGRRQVPTSVQQTLRFVPAAVLAALVCPALVYRDGTLDVSLGNARLLAGVLAAVVAWRTRNVLLTTGVGMGVLWIVQVLT